MKVLSIAILVMTVAATDAAAQSNSSVPTGSRVRVATSTNPDRRVIGTIVSQDENGLKLAVGTKGDIIIPRSAIVEMDLSLKRKSHAGGGIALGLIAGLLVGLLTSEEAKSGCSSPECYLLGKDTVTALRGGAGALVGGLVGGAIGASIRTDQWTPVDHRWRVNVAPVRKSGALSLSIKF